LPDASGHFGRLAARFVAETLRAALDELTLAYSKYREGRDFQAELADEFAHYVGRPSPDLPASASRASWAARRSTSSARTSTTPGPTR
jgi:tryptophan synthase beta subunit